MLILKLIGLSVIFLGIAFGAMALRILFKKDGKFPEHRVGHNREMRKRKIYCVKTQDKIEQNKLRKRRNIVKTQKLIVAGEKKSGQVDYSELSFK